METQKFNQIYKENKGMVEMFLKPKLYPRTELVDDFVSETFTKVYEKYDLFHPEKSSLSTWIINIAKNIMLDYFRSVKREKQSTNSYMDSKHQTDEICNINSGFVTDAEMIYNESRNLLVKAIKKLDIDMQKIAELRYFEQYEYKQIAEELNLPMGTVKVNLHRIKQFIVKNVQVA